MSYNGSLTAWLREQPGLLSLQQVVYIVSGAAAALQQLHNQSSIHQDINPSSFLISMNGENAEHFGLQLANPGARSFSRFGKSYPANSQLVYMAPEQWNGQAVPATDQYALAVMAYELLTGQPPFQGPPAQLMDLHMRVQPAAPSTLNQRVSSAADALILSALAKRPEDRFSSVSAFAHALEQVVLHSEPPTLSIPSVTVDGILRATLLIDKAEASTGALRTITLPQGRRITVAVPGGSHDGQVIRLEGFGEPSSMGGPSGSLLLTLAVNPAKTSKSTVDLTNEKKTLPLFTSSLFSSSKSSAASIYTTFVNLSPVRKAAFLATPILILILVSVGIFSLIQSNASVPIPYPPNSGTLALNDLLHNNSGGYGWPESTNSNGGTCQFAQGTYHVSVTKEGAFHYCIAGATGFSNFVYEVRMTIINGDEGGIIFRANGINSKFYYFRIGRDGSYGLYLYIDDAGTHAQTLVSGMAPAVRTGLNIANLLAVEAHNGNLDLYVNKQHIASVSNNTYDSGQVGVAAAYGTEPTEVAFSNARVWSI